MSADALVTVAVLYSLPAAAVARSALEARGVPVVAVGGHVASVDWAYLVALGGIELRVPAAQEPAARALLAEGERPPLRESAAFRHRWIWNALVFLLLLIPVGAIPFWMRRQGETR